MPLFSRSSIRHSSVRSQFFKTYVSTTYLNTLKISSRIRIMQDGIHLQMLTSSNLSAKLKKPPTIRERLFGSDWYTLLKIDNKKQAIYYDESYNENQSNLPITAFIPPEDIIFPEKLFGVPDNIWETFISHLEHQEVVTLLDLKQHRHLWAAYHYALSAPTPSLVLSRAKLIGRFHFLLSFALYDPREITQQQSFAKQEQQFLAFQDIKKHLDQGQFAKRSLLQIYNGLSLLFIHKLSHCSNIWEFDLLANLVTNYAQDALGAFDNDRKARAIGMLPSSVTEPARFSSALNLAKMVRNMNAKPGFLFFNSQQHWSASSTKFSNLANLGKHYFDALFNDLVLRQVILQAHATYREIDQACLTRIKERFESFFLKKTGVHKIAILHSYWQHNSHHLSALKPAKSKPKFWSPLIAKTKINGITITPLSSEESLIRHGKWMQHCVQTNVFVDLCRNLGADIFELVSEDGEMSTLDIRPSYSNGYHIIQHVSVGGIKKPSQHHIKVGLQVLDDICSGCLSITKARQIPYADNYSNYQFEYELDDLSTQELIYQEYKAKKMLPSSLVFANYLHMLEATNLVNLIDEALKNSADFDAQHLNHRLAN